MTRRQGCIREAQDGAIPSQIGSNTRHKSESKSNNRLINICTRPRELHRLHIQVFVFLFTRSRLASSRSVASRCVLYLGQNGDFKSNTVYNSVYSVNIRGKTRTRVYKDIETDIRMLNNFIFHLFLPLYVQTRTVLHVNESLLTETP